MFDRDATMNELERVERQLAEAKAELSDVLWLDTWLHDEDDEFDTDDEPHLRWLISRLESKRDELLRQLPEVRYWPPSQKTP